MRTGMWQAEFIVGNTVWVNTHDNIGIFSSILDGTTSYAAEVLPDLPRYIEN